MKHFPSTTQKSTHIPQGWASKKMIGWIWSISTDEVEKLTQLIPSEAKASTDCGAVLLHFDSVKMFMQNQQSV